MDEEIRKLMDEVRGLTAEAKTLLGQVKTEAATSREAFKEVGDLLTSHKNGGKLVTDVELKQLIATAVDLSVMEKSSRGILTQAQTDAVRIPDPWSQTGDYFEYEPDPTRLIQLSMDQTAKQGRFNADGWNRVLGLPCLDDAHRHLCRMGFHVQLLDGIGRRFMKDDYPGFKLAFPKTAMKWRRYQQLYTQHVRAASDAMDTVDTSNWVPTGWSSEIREKIMLEAVVAALFPSFQMPYSPYIIPLDMTDTYGNYMPETTDIISRDITTGAVGQIQALDDQQRTLTAVKLRARMRLSGELTEDAITAVLPLIQAKIIRILAHTKDYAIINGQKAGVIDTNYTAGTFDAREAFDGLRKEADVRNGYVDFGNTGPSITNVLGQRLELGEIGATVGDLVNIWGISGYLKYLMANVENINAAERFRENITYAGEASQTGGVPNVISRDMPENLAANGKYDGVTTNRTCMLTANVRCFVYGERRAVTAESERIIQTDQTELVAMERGTFKSVYPTVKIVSSGHNIPTS